MLGVDAATYKLFNIGSPVSNLKYEMALKDETVFSGNI